MNPASGSTWRRWSGIVVLAATSGAAGWALGEHGHGAREAAAPGMAETHVATRPRASTSVRPETVIQSFADGTVSVHADRVAAGWLLLELGRLGAVPDEGDAIADEGAVVLSESSCEPADRDSDVVNVELIERTLTEGTESERYAALMEALQEGIDLPPELLRLTYVSEPSESLRLLAFATYVDSISYDRTEVRAALQGGVYDSSPGVQAEAQRRLSDLEEYERVLSETPPQGLP